MFYTIPNIQILDLPYCKSTRLVVQYSTSTNTNVGEYSFTKRASTETMFLCRLLITKGYLVFSIINTEFKVFIRKLEKTVSSMTRTC